MGSAAANQPQERLQSGSNSFASASSYWRAIRETHSRMRSRALACSTPSEEMLEIRSRSGAEMQRKLKWFDLIAMGVGGMVGAGIFVTTGTAASVAGPSVLLSYLFAGISALLSAFCYTEFAVQMPVAGGAFSYLRITFGEFAAFFTGANLLMEYVVSNAAVARSFTSYFSTIFGVAAWRVEITSLHSRYNQLDLPAVALLLIITIFLCYSTKDSSIFNMVMTIAHVLFILFIIVAGFIKGDVRNLTHPAHPELSSSGFFPFGARGVFNGAAIVYFSYIGYDAVSTLAEEVEQPVKRNIPIGVAGSVVIVSILYCLMAASMSMLVPYDIIDADASYPMAFKKVGWDWAAKLVSIGASLGIFTSLLVAMLGQARYLCVIGRSHVVPAWFARVNPTTRTPINATVFLGVCTSLIALFTDLSVLLNMISIGTLFVFYMVANAAIFHRHVVRKITNPWPTLVFLLLFSASAIGFAIIWHLGSELWWGLVFFGVSCLLLTVIFWWRVPQAHTPQEWGAPMMPWLAAASIFLNVFLLGSVDSRSYIRFGFWSLLVGVFYVVYSVHASFDAELNGDSESKGIQMADVEQPAAGKVYNS